MSSTEQQATGANGAEQEANGGTALVRHDAPLASAFGGGIEAFRDAQRMAQALTSSTLVPKEYRNNLPNCLVAMEMAHRLGASVLMVMQNLVIIHGKPTWSAQFVISGVNSCGRFTPIRYTFVGEKGTDEYGCYASATERRTGELLVGETITIGMAKAEGWYHRDGSKWKTIPGLMLRYRSASWWGRVFCPEIMMGMHTSDEIEDADVIDESPASDLNERLRERQEQAEGDGARSTAEGEGARPAVTQPTSANRASEPSTERPEPSKKRPEPTTPAGDPYTKAVEAIREFFATEKKDGRGTAVEKQKNDIRELAVKVFDDGTDEREATMGWADNEHLERAQAGKLNSLLQVALDAKPKTSGQQQSLLD